MTKFSKRIIAAVSAGTMFLSFVGPVAATYEEESGDTITITGNGYNSDNYAKVYENNDTTVYQSNNAIVTNTVSADANTGGNDANQNTGGDAGIMTGDATTKVEVSNLLNQNTASVDCCDAGDLDVLISENGADSYNKAKIYSDSDIYVTQDNNAIVTNNVDADAKTGYNDANQNTGGEVLVSTGNAWTEVAVDTSANVNMAQVGGEGDGADISAKIIGNGYNSTNKIKLWLDNDTTLNQANHAIVTNIVDADAKTGYNDANQNTGGDVLLSTGWAKTLISVDNAVNFNAAEVDCGCLSDLDLKIGVNGTDTYNKIKVYFDNDLWVDQGFEKGGNYAILTNLLEGDSKTGKNDLDQNTGDPEGDPFILTGDAYSKTEVSNQGNVNVYGDIFDWELPELPELPEFDFNFSFALNWSQLFGFFHLV